MNMLPLPNNNNRKNQNNDNHHLWISDNDNRRIQIWNMKRIYIYNFSKEGQIKS